MKKYDAIIIGGAVEDVSFFVNDGKVIKDDKKEAYIGFKLGTKIGIDKTHLSMGGGASNVSTGLANFGLNVAPMICLGKDERGQKIIKNFEKSKISTELIQLDPQESTGFSFICGFDKKKLHIVFSHRGSANNLKIESKKLAQIETRWIHTSSLSGKMWPKNISEIIKYKKVNQAKWSWNPGGTQLKAGRNKLAKYLKEVDVLFVNRSEAQEIVGGAKKSADKNLERISKMGPKIIVITDGANGAHVYDSVDERQYYHSARAKKILDTTGAGDSFASGFIAGMLKYDEVRKALKLAIENSQAVLSQIGAQQGLLTQKDLKRFFK